MLEAGGLDEPTLESLREIYERLGDRPRLTQTLERKLMQMPELIVLHAISGEYDMIIVVEAEGVSALNDVVDRIGVLDGVEKTTTSSLMATKVVRGEG